LVVRLLFYQANYTVLVTAPPVHHARAAVFGVTEQEEVVAHQFHLEEGLVKGHRPGHVELLPHHQRPVSLHLDRDHAIR